MSRVLADQVVVAVERMARDVAVEHLSLVVETLAVIPLGKIGVRLVLVSA